ncbi:hypothetical protein [Pantoea endophytica]
MDVTSDFPNGNIDVTQRFGAGIEKVAMNGDPTDAELYVRHSW